MDFAKEYSKLAHELYGMFLAQNSLLAVMATLKSEESLDAFVACTHENIKKLIDISDRLKVLDSSMELMG